LKSANERLVLGNSLWKARNAFCNVNPKDMYDFTDYKSLFTCKLASKDEITQTIGYLKDSKFRWWYVNDQTLNELSKIVKEKSIVFKHLQVIENNGAYLFENQIDEYKIIFKCKIANNYASKEVWNIAYSCKCGYLHINDHVYLELIDDEGNVIPNPNKEGNVIITSLILKTMPFIRYGIGDRACWVEGKCACGNDNRRILLSPGRQKINGTDLYGNIVLKNVVTKLLTQYNLTKYSEINIIQTSIDFFTVNIKGCQENKRFMEKAILASANSILNDKQYHYEFTYDENKKFKSLFASY
jgi:phenylacetate-coenzyme A ligase PaaK-like adenylate-forming protein